MAAQLIKLDSSPNQTFQVTLNINNQKVTLNVELSFNETAGYWVMTIFNGQGVLLLSSIPCLTGDWPAANILCQYAYLAIGSAYFINVSNATADYPTSSDLGTDFNLVWDDTAA